VTRVSTTAIVVMGVSGSGKTTLARRLADHLQWEFVEGDDFHPPANVAKMAGGTPLTDEDRWPWLGEIAQHIATRQQAGVSLVVTCSALRRVYRDVLRSMGSGVSFVHVEAAHDTILQRMRARVDHFMPASLLTSQEATLEPLEPDESGVVIGNAGTPDDVLQRALDALESIGALPAPRPS